jgi:hypothetical protein
MRFTLVTLALVIALSSSPGQAQSPDDARTIAELRATLKLVQQENDRLRSELAEAHRQVNPTTMPATAPAPKAVAVAKPTPATVAPAVQKRSDESEVVEGVMNKPMRVGLWTVTVKRVDYPQAWAGRTTSGEFVAVTIEIENRGTAPARFLTPCLIDANKRRYDGNLDMSDLVATFNPGVSRTIRCVFETPKELSCRMIVGDDRITPTSYGIITLP